jgi:hypothetical protein
MATPSVLHCIYFYSDQFMDPDILGYTCSQVANQHPIAHPAIYDLFMHVYHVPPFDKSIWMDGVGWSNVYISLSE